MSKGRWTAGVGAAALSAGLVVGSVVVATDDSRHASPVAVPSPAATDLVRRPLDASLDDPVDRVIAISVDGLNPQAITRLGQGRAPALHRMMREGAGTLNARAEYEQTVTLPNSTGMLTGRRVDKARGGHGVTVNVDGGQTVHEAAGRYVASVFDVVHDRGGSTALFSAKIKFALYARTWNDAGAADKIGPDNGRAKIDRVVLDTDNVRLVDEVNAELRTAPRTFALVHLATADAAGHANGFMSPAYLTAVEQVDRLVGSILDTVAGSPSLAPHTLIVLTTDHGGSGRSHDAADRVDNYRIPFLVWGPGVARGRDLYALNPQLRDPGAARPGYTGPQPVRNGDLANLSTDVLDLPTVPGSQFDRPRELNVFG